MVYVFCAFCAGLAGLMLTSNSTSADPNSIGLFIELDAILAVVIVGYLMMSGGGGILGGGGGQSVQQGRVAGSGNNVACDTEAELFSCRVMTSTEQTWGRIFQEQGATYRPATINFYQRNAPSGCGAGR